MHYKSLAIIALFLLPSIAFGAGFAKQSLFLSKTPVTEGEQVLVHTVVQNDTATKFDGSLVFFAKGTGEKDKIGTVAVSIAPGGANTVSVSWKPDAGEYVVTAEITAKDGTVIETQSANFSIAKKPTTTFVSFNGLSDGDTEVQSSADVQAMIAKFSPTVANYAHPAFLTIDSWRGQAAKIFDQGEAWAQKKMGTKAPGEVLGATTKDPSPKNLLSTFEYVTGFLSAHAFSILNWIVANTGVFYPVVAISFLFALWKLFSRFRRPSY